MDIGSICLCLTVGALIVFASIGIGVCIGNGRSDEEQHDSDSDVIVYIPVRHRNRSGNKNNNPPTFEEKMMVLNTLRVGTSGFEQKVIDCIQEDMINERNKMDSRREEASQN